MKPETQWLQKKWAMPDAACASAAVDKLFAAQTEGSTALKLEAPVSDWGRAAAAPDGDPTTPLVVLDHNASTFVQTRWFFETEKKIAHFLTGLNSDAAVACPPEKLAIYFSEEGRQRDAAVMALAKRLTVITGGPGTGKTYTLARILALLIDGGIDPQSIQLTAPTGKASDRMKEAVNEACKGLEEGLRAKLEAASSSSKTIHALIGHHPGKNSCTYHAGHRLPCKVLIVDECSMVDTMLWKALLEALPNDARLILLGDPNQLESVGRGNVFSEIAASEALKSARVHLTVSRRFSDRPAIAQLALAIEDRKAEEAVTLLAKNQEPTCPGGLFWNESAGISQILKNLPPAVFKAMQAVAFASAPEEALQALNKVRILTSHRIQSTGGDSLVSEIEKILTGQNPGQKILNRPIIINRNDPETGLRNGEVGIVFSGGDGLKVHFDKREAVSVSKLPEHSPAWTITIHRSQGSEYENVVVVLPKKSDSPLATRQLLYTAITRSKQSLFVYGPAEVIQKAISHTGQRTTLLEFHLGSSFSKVQ
jgi:exodeoxyribonuclease V alpha subunit